MSELALAVTLFGLVLNVCALLILLRVLIEQKRTLASMRQSRKHVTEMMEALDKHENNS